MSGVDPLQLMTIKPSVSIVIIYRLAAASAAAREEPIDSFSKRSLGVRVDGLIPPPVLQLIS